MHELQRRHGPSGPHARGLNAVSFHPGVIGTNFAAGQNTLLGRFYQIWGRRLAGPAVGADTLVWLAEATPGINYPAERYYVNRKPARTHRSASNPDLARELWTRTEQLLGSRLG